MPFARPHKRFVSLLRPSASQVHDAEWQQKLKTWGKACGLALGEGGEQHLCNLI